MQENDYADFLSELYGKDLIIYGTGHTARTIVPYLIQNPKMRIQGATNSRIRGDRTETFLRTGLLIRSLESWAAEKPNASILITAIRGCDEIFMRCREVGFQDIIFPPLELVEASVKMAEDDAESQMSGTLEYMCLANEIHDIHLASFHEFKGCHRGRDIVIVGCGPTLNYYSQIDGAVHIGTNSSFLREHLKLDYYFLIHYIPEWCSKLKKKDFIKFFYVNRNDNTDDKFPEHIIEENNGRTFFQSSLTAKIQPNIEYYPLMGFGSVIFPAIQFALYTRPKRIFLVGCDCSTAGHFDGRLNGRFGDKTHVVIWLKGYHKLKIFAKRYYPDTELISVNPVGLRGLFRDVYTEEFLNEHPEIERDKCGIFTLGNC